MTPAKPYLPEADFLKRAAGGELAFDQGASGQSNLKRLLTFVADEDVRNRDWAAFLIAQLPLDTPEIRAALWQAVDGEEGVVRDEALVGLARRDPQGTFATVEACLQAFVSPPLLEAAEILGDPRLLPNLYDIRKWAPEPEFRPWLEAAIAACEAARG